MPHLFEGIRRSRLYGTDPTPVEARKQRFELGMAQHHQTVLDAGQVKVCSSSRL
jgi:hypothetical protein